MTKSLVRPTADVETMTVSPVDEVILVFYHTQEGHAIDLTHQLRHQNFTVTIEQTDFSELGWQHLLLVHYDAYIKYTQPYRVIAYQVNDLLQSLGLKRIKLIEVSKLVGTVQVGLL